MRKNPQIMHQLCSKSLRTLYIIVLLIMYGCAAKKMVKMYEGPEKPPELVAVVKAEGDYSRRMGEYDWSRLGVTIANVDGNFGSSTTIDLSDTCSGVDDRHEITSSGTISGTGLTVSHMLLLRIYRSDTGADDTWVGTTAAQSPAILEFDIHFEVNTMGSRQETVK